MPKLAIKYKGKDIDFLLHDLPQHLIRREAGHLSEIILGKTYSIVNNLKPEVIIDVGAHIGAASFFFAKSYPKSQIFSFEPTTMNFSLLQKNMKYFPNVKIFHKGIYEENKKQKIYINTTNPGTNSIHEKWRKFDNYEYADFINLKDFLKKNNIKHIDILKIDTEGCEINIIQSIKSFITKISVIYLEYHSEEQGLKIRNLLSSTHNIKKHQLCGVETVSLNDSIVGKIILENIIHNGNTIIFRGQTINPKHVMELRKIGCLPIKVQSKQLGEICFVNKKINL